ncbi:hypothetical protein M2444_000696 [Paenibacillus sp. PastF-3]|nr:hypothetical protein [Paenibacillus sp. PastF-3]
MCGYLPRGRQLQHLAEQRFLVSEREYRRAFDSCGLRQVGVRHTLDNHQIGNSNMLLSNFGKGTMFLSTYNKNIVPCRTRTWFLCRIPPSNAKKQPVNHGCLQSLNSVLTAIWLEFSHVFLQRNLHNPLRPCFLVHTEEAE